jgi:hypothetical protein
MPAQRNHPMKRNATQLGRTMKMEWLEPRLLLAADIALAGGVLTVTGSSGNEAIEVREVGEMGCNDRERRFFVGL